MVVNTRLTHSPVVTTRKTDNGKTLPLFIGGVRESKRFGLTYYRYFVVNTRTRREVANGEFSSETYARRAAERVINTLNRLAGE